MILVDATGPTDQDLPTHHTVIVGIVTRELQLVYSFHIYIYCCCSCVEFKTSCITGTEIGETGVIEIGESRAIEKEGKAESRGVGDHLHLFLLQRYHLPLKEDLEALVLASSMSLNPAMSGSNLPLFLRNISFCFKT